MKSVFLFLVLVVVQVAVVAGTPPMASWYGEEYRGRTMANGQAFDPDRLTCASWFYPLGAVIEVRSARTNRRVRVVVTDRGPDKGLVSQGRAVDLSAAAFSRIAHRDVGLERVWIRRVQSRR